MNNTIDACLNINEKLADLCSDMVNNFINVSYKPIIECFPQRKMTHEQRAHIQNLVFDLEVILQEDDLIPESNVVHLNKFMRGK